MKRNLLWGILLVTLVSSPLLGQKDKPDGMARVVFFRDHTGSVGPLGPASGRSVTVLCDGRPMADLSWKRYFTLLLTPGAHKIASSWDKSNRKDEEAIQLLELPVRILHEISVEAGKTYYIGFNQRFYNYTVKDSKPLMDLADRGGKVKVQGGHIVWFGYEITSHELAMSQLKDRKPIDAKRVKSSTMVSLEPLEGSK